MNDEVIGYVINVSSSNIIHVALKNVNITKYDYVYYISKEFVDGEFKDIKVLGQVIEIRREPYRLGTELYIADVLDIMPRESIVEISIAKVLILGYRIGNRVLYPKSIPQVGTPIYKANDNDIRNLISIDSRYGLHIGYLASKNSIPIYLDINGLRRHLSIIAATGSGKTWSAILIIEELLKKGATILVIDPHGEYVPISKSINRLSLSKDNVIVLKVAPHQYGDLIYRIDISKIDSETLSTIAKIPQTATRIRYVVHLVHKLIKYIRKITGIKEICTIDNMIKILNALLTGSLKGIQNLVKILNLNQDVLESLVHYRSKIDEILDELLDFSDSKSKRFSILLAKIYLRRLQRLGVYTYCTTPLNQFLKPQCLTILNLAGVSDEIQDHIVYHVLNRVLKARIRHVRKLKGVKYPYPVVIIIEEAHRFVPPKSKRRTWSQEIITRIACEGRKFGTYLIVITQRPSKIDQDVLSQCNSQIILRIVNPKDLDAVVKSSEVLSDEILKLIPQLNVGEAVILGPITTIPIIVQLRDRVLDYGGGDLDILKLWQKALKDRENTKKIENVVNRLLNVSIKVNNWDSIEKLSRTIRKTEFEFNILRGYVDDVYVEVRFNEKSWNCTKCGVNSIPCNHVLALIYKAYVDGILSNIKYF